MFIGDNCCAGVCSSKTIIQPNYSRTVGCSSPPLESEITENELQREVECIFSKKQAVLKREAKTNEFLRGKHMLESLFKEF